MSLGELALASIILIVLMAGKQIRLEFSREDRRVERRPIRHPLIKLLLLGAFLGGFYRLT